MGPEPVVPPLPTAYATLKGKVTDLDDKPLEAIVRLAPLGGGPGRVLDATPEFQARVDPGDYQVEVQAPEYLARGGAVTAKADETVILDLVLRPRPSVNVAQLMRERIEINQTIQFAFNEARILPQSFYILDEVTDILLRNVSLKIRIEGHTDEVGSPEYNLTLSEGRANAVRAYLVDHGIPGSRLSVKGWGMARPIASNRSEDGRAKNRRVQFEIESSDSQSP
jgi:outer membrane protein OmpA-like peptidoglycan-associated protein